MSSHAGSQQPEGRYLLTLTLGALGVVYGDIGTSPLYALRECFNGPHGVPVTQDNVYGVLSLIFWVLLLLVTIKYVIYVLRADNRGEGGILALMALAVLQSKQNFSQRKRWMLLVLGVFGSALLYGDGMITPAISVLSAVEGLKVATPALEPYVIPITLVILVGIFVAQQQGSGGLGAFFGPVTLIWFVVMALTGIPWILQHPHVLQALSPHYGLAFLWQSGWHGVTVMGSVFLVVTGGEALYADMGHFGRKPIRLAWFALVFPALLLNYFGQGAFVLSNPAGAAHPFFMMAPSWTLYPLVGLAAMATVIASQALISGAFSLTRQAVQFGYSPRVEIVHTSAEEVGQIYIPGINWFLLICVIGLVLGFKSSSNLAAAYGIAVTVTMLITSVFIYFVAVDQWGWKRWRAGLLVGFLLPIELAFFAANAMKIPQGGWFPLVVAGMIFTLLVTWKTGRGLVTERLKAGALPMDLFLMSMESHPPTTVSGTAIFMAGNSEGAPHALLHNLKHNKVLHKRVIFLTVKTEDIPHVPEEDQIQVEKINDTFYRIIASYGFMQDPNVPRLLLRCEKFGLTFNMMETTFFLGRETLIPTRKHKGMALWRERLFVAMSKNARSATDFFRLPPNRVVELGAQIEI